MSGEIQREPLNVTISYRNVAGIDSDHVGRIVNSLLWWGCECERSIAAGAGAADMRSMARGGIHDHVGPVCTLFCGQLCHRGVGNGGGF